MERGVCNSSWLRNHVRHFVVPSLKALQRDPDAQITRYGSLDFSARNMRPAKGYFSPEAGLVASALFSFGLMTPEREYLLKDCSPSEWGASSRMTDAIKRALILHSFAKAAMKTLTNLAMGRLVVLPGRDVWAFHILARKYNCPSLYDPRISRQTAAHQVALRKILAGWRVDFRHILVFDTGFAGTIADAIRRAVGAEVDDRMLSTPRRREGVSPSSLQIFPHHKGARGKALDIEYLPKYFKTATVVDEEATQYYAPLDAFLRAVAMTIWWWYARSPRFVPSERVLRPSQTTIKWNAPPVPKPMASPSNPPPLQAPQWQYTTISVSGSTATTWESVPGATADNNGNTYWISSAGSGATTTSEAWVW